MVSTQLDGPANLERRPSLPRVRSANALKDAAGQELGTNVLSNVEWVRNLYNEPEIELLATCGAMSQPNKSISVDPDHLFLSMLRQRLIADICFMYSREKQIFHTLVALGPDVAGHPRVTHGGFTSAVIDETTGGLVYELKKSGCLGPGPAFTAHLEVDFKKPLPVNINVICTAWVTSIEGRKCWTAAEMRDEPGGTIFATGKALYVTPRQAAETEQKT
jgi:acyl-coenzyme A thioesterase PaaI-like protein